MKYTFHHGSAADLKDAVEQKIAELSGVESSTTVEASLSNSGSIFDLEDAIRGKIHELGGVTSSEVVDNICPQCGAPGYVDGVCNTCGYVVDDTDPFDGGLSYEDDIYSREDVKASQEDDPTYRERYLHTLIGDLSDHLEGGGIRGTIFDNDETNLYITISTKEAPATEYQVPFADLKMDFDKIDQDIDYILDGILPKQVEAAAVLGFTSEPDALYVGYHKMIEKHCSELEKRYNAGNESPYDILVSLGYQEVAEDVYHKEEDPYTLVFDFNQGNTYDSPDYFVMYYVLKDGDIPAGWCPTKVNIEDPEAEMEDVFDDDEPGYRFIRSKSVTDSDGFNTDYTWYKDEDGLNIFIFGDKDIYDPSNTSPDHEEEDDKAAREWFDSYTGFDDEDEDDDWVTYDADDIYSCDDAKVHIYGTSDIDASAFDRDWYFGKEQADQFGDLIQEKLSGRTVSKRRDLADAPGGLIYEANQLGIDMWDLLGALEGMCYQRRAREIDDSTYKVL